jgi:hypothetical protein
MLNNEKEWVKIFASSNGIKTKWLQSSIEANEIEVVALNKKDSMLPIGEIELYVAKENEEQALLLIKNSNNENFMDEE